MAWLEPTTPQASSSHISLSPTPSSEFSNPTLTAIRRFGPQSTAPQFLKQPASIQKTMFYRRSIGSNARSCGLEVPRHRACSRGSISAEAIVIHTILVLGFANVKETLVKFSGEVAMETDCSSDEEVPVDGWCDMNYESINLSRVPQLEAAKSPDLTSFLATFHLPSSFSSLHRQHHHRRRTTSTFICSKWTHNWVLSPRQADSRQVVNLSRRR